MIGAIRRVAAATTLALMLAGGTAAAEKVGGVLRVHVWDSPPNLSMLDGVNPLAARTMMPVFNNLVMFDQHAKQSRLDAIVPDLATSWTWNEDATELTFRLRQGVKWTTADRLARMTSSAPGISSSTRAPRSSASTRANRGTGIWSRSAQTATAR